MQGQRSELAPARGGAAARSLHDGHNLVTCGLADIEHLAEPAKRWRFAADQGHPIAQFNLGFRYAEGRGVPQDDGEAVHWYRLAAEQGLAVTQSNLGSMYAEGSHRGPSTSRPAVSTVRRAD